LVWKQHEKLAGTWQTFGLENKKEKGTKLLMMTFEFRSTCYLIAVFLKN
jgi:hypothetical protein